MLGTILSIHLHNQSSKHTGLLHTCSNREDDPHVVTAKGPLGETSPLQTTGGGSHDNEE